MLKTILDEEEIKEALEEEENKVKVGFKKLALMHKDTILQLFDVDEYMENIEYSAIQFVKNTLQSDNIDLCYIVIDKKYYNITYKNIILNDIIIEESEDYQKINNHIYVVSPKELKEELLNYSKDIFNKMLSDAAYYEISNEITYNDCISWIYEEVKKTYNNSYTIYTTNNSFLLHGSYKDVITTDFENNYHYILSEDTKLFLIDDIENSDLSGVVKKEIIENIKNY